MRCDGGQRVVEAPGKHQRPQDFAGDVTDSWQSRAAIGFHIGSHFDHQAGCTVETYPKEIAPDQYIPFGTCHLGQTSGIVCGSKIERGQD